MSLDLLVSLGIAIVFLITTLILYRKLSTLQPQKHDDSLLSWLQSMQNSLETTNKTLNDALRHNTNDMVKTLQENSRQLNERLDKAAQVIGNVGKEVGQMSEIGRSMRELQEFLKSPKIRGNIGEHVLKDLISQMFPKNSFHLQYQFKSGERVDAMIKTEAGILPIDAKFPMENFQKLMKEHNEIQQEAIRKDFAKDIKRHIDAIAKKYVLPDEGTMDFALMYVPSEAVYYELVNTDDIMEYAKRSRVYVVSPSTLYAHLQTILLSFEGKRIETHARQVLQTLRALQIDYEKVNENLGILGKHLTNASAQFTNVTSGFAQIGNKLETTKFLEKAVVEELQVSNQ